MTPKPAPLPETIDAGPYTFEVSTDESDFLRMCRQMRADLYGATDFPNLRIIISADVAPAKQRNTILHELLHVVIDTTNADENLDGEAEEALVQRLSPLLLDTLRRNPQLVTFLMDGAA